MPQTCQNLFNFGLLTFVFLNTKTVLFLNSFTRHQLYDFRGILLIRAFDIVNKKNLKHQIIYDNVLSRTT